MMNYIWAGMLCLGIGFACVSGNLSSFTDGLMESCTEAVEFVISLIGIMAVWSGLMNIADKSGLIEKISRKVRPLMHYLFPLEKDDQTIAVMLMSFVANIFGAGNSATVFSLKAMERLDDENQQSPYASNAMCMFTAVTMSMVQLVPVTIIKIRNDLGSVNSGSIIIPSIIAGLISMVVSVAVCKFFERKYPDVHRP
ncbi:spore maturation protein [Anaerovorax odorimutans]|uniref:Spore maturation protein n=1 Tax=Anaerovorax odorimutans TaxID=109327 RepID=A0ABT1RRZ6_9FIRM|nr:nucleoside recognition domain-containing protein [Anaerovorax odorimutans]MCQ4637985.1 spore maturation protein [Anaerovorax odorimutans]